ncbi:MAG: hypothetical protein JSU74_11440 [Candidatus Zixiibacteriota bacterium]|nr:MAG: hypothetical protein JSU74_11440 [candidate division Zixibacteria bacterium]
MGRPLAMYKHFPSFGIECDVLTVKPVAYRQYEPELLRDLDTKRIYRAGSHDPQRLMYMLGVRRVRDAAINRGRRVTEWFFPDPKAGWVRAAVRLGRTLATNRHYRCIITTSPPISAHLVGRAVSTEFNLPWIADFRDFWTGYRAEDWFASGRQVRRAKNLLEDIAGRSATMTAVSPAIADYLGKGNVIYNSYDDDRAKLWKSPAPGDYFIIGVLGTLDELRPIEPLFELLSYVRRHRPDRFEKIRVRLVGSNNLPEFEPLVARYQLTDRVESFGSQKRERTIALLSDASMLYIGLAPPHNTWLVTGRVFDMLASGRPILAATPQESVLGRLLSETRNSCLFDENLWAEASDYIVARMAEYERGDLQLHSVPTYAEEYSSTKMVEKFAGLIGEIS